MVVEYWSTVYWRPENNWRVPSSEYSAAVQYYSTTVQYSTVQSQVPGPRSQVPGPRYRRKVRPKHVSAIKFATVLAYATVIFPIVCVARYVAELVNQHEPQCMTSGPEGLWPAAGRNFRRLRPVFLPRTGTARPLLYLSRLRPAAVFRSSESWI